MQRISREPQVIDVIFAVSDLNRYKKGTPEYTNAHKEAVKQVKIYNDFHGHNEYSMSIGKARNLIQMRDLQDKQKEEADALRQASIQALRQQRDKKKGK